MSAHLLPEDEFHARLDAGLWWKVFQHGLRLKRFLIPLAFTAMGIAALDASFAQVTRWTIDAVMQHGPHADLRPYVGLYFLLTVLISLGVWVFIELAGKISNHMSHDIRRLCFDRLQELEFAFYDHRPVGWLITRLTSDCDRLARIIAWGSLDLVWGTCFVIMIAVSLLLMNWRLALIVLAVLPPLAVVSKVFQRMMLLSHREIRKFNSQITAAYHESIQGVRTTKTLVREADNLHEFQHRSAQMFAASVKNARQSAVYFPVVMTLGSLAAGLALWGGGHLSIVGGMTLGTLVAFINFAGQFFNPINQMARVLTEMQAAQAAGERVMGLLATEPKIRDSEAVRQRMSEAKASAPSASDTRSPVSDCSPDGHPAKIESIEFRHVTFAYEEGSPVLRDFNLTVRAGQTIALVGQSGGGKSTIVSLVCRFYEPTQGALLINGVDYRQRSLHWLQSQLGIVLQTPHLFKGTVRENIRYGRLDAADAEVEEAARLVSAHEFILQMEHGYDTPVGEGGNRLSTGQKQLVSFARALLARPQVFVMDEATSSIDTETEQAIQAGIERILAGRISFVIAHRLSTIRRADRILVINRGLIEESGTHDELLRRRGHYHELYTSQFRREREEAVLENLPSQIL
jgi:ATP-binding cassette subfamily B protein